MAEATRNGYDNLRCQVGDSLWSTTIRRGPEPQSSIGAAPPRPHRVVLGKNHRVATATRNLDDTKQCASWRLHRRHDRREQDALARNLGIVPKLAPCVVAP